MSTSIDAYAKINLTLDITGRRADGYHLLRMVMQSVSLCDRLTITQGEPGIRIVCARADVPCNESNTAYKAAAAFFAFSGIQPGVTVEIEKNVPSQAGLGGGSSDAAAVLHALNEMYRTGYSNKTLCEIGVKVGADVPFCILGGTALAEGIGEKLTALPPMPKCHLVLCKPPVGVDTKKAYAKADSAGLIGSYTNGMLQAVQSGSLHAVAENLGNAFEQVMQLDEVAQIKQIMKSAGALGACMSGSGSAVYGIFESPEAAQECKTALSGRFEQVFLCEPVQFS